MPAPRSFARIALAALAAVGSASMVPGMAAAQDPAPPAVPFPDTAIPAGVSVGGVDVSGVAGLVARQRVYDQFVAARRAPMPVSFGGRQFTISPDAIGYTADVDGAILVAYQQAPAPGQVVDVPVRESISRATLRTVLTWRAAQYAMNGRDAAVTLRGLQPIIRPARLGTEIDVPRSVAVLAPVFTAPRPATPVALVTRRVRPTVTSVGSVIVIDKSAFRLRLYRGTTRRGGVVMRRIRTYPIAIGQAAYPTPTGNFTVIQKQVNPTWFPPDSEWAKGLGEIPPGDGNPLGTRWIGTSAPAIGIHGTPNPSSIGTAASHGCIRMYIGDVENLFGRVTIGTRVFIRR